MQTTFCRNSSFLGLRFIFMADPYLLWARLTSTVAFAFAVANETPHPTHVIRPTWLPTHPFARIPDSQSLMSMLARTVDVDAANSR